jgi:tripartite ATP-independent transporter DctP family solute receptor
MKRLINVLGIIAILALLAIMPAAALAQDVSCESEVVVQADDWLSKIADKFYGNVLAFPAIMEATNAQGGDYATIANPDVIEPGWKLCIPPAEYAQTVMGEGEMMAMAPPLEVTGDPVTLQWASVSVPDDAHTKGMQVFADAVSRISNGNVTVELFPGGQLFTQEGQQDALRSGNLDIAYSGPNWLAEFVPYMSMFAAPYMFTSYDHMSSTFNGPIGEQIFDDVAAQTGLRPLGAFYLGTRQVNLRDIGREVMTPADMEGVKLRMPNSPTWLFMGEALGANPTPLAFTEVYLGLQTGTIDGQDNPLPTDRNAKFYEVTKYIVLTDHYINPIFPTINEAKWQSLTPSQQEAVKLALEEARQFVDDANLQQEAELLAFFEGEGMTIITPDKQAFIDFAQDKTLNNAEMTATWDMDLFRQIQASASGEMALEVTGDPVTLQWASVSVPDDAHTKGMQVFADELAKISNGNVTVELFPGGQLFTQEGQQDALRSGNLDIAYSGPNWLAEFVPYMSMFAAPYMFTSYDHMSSTFNGPIGEQIFDDVAAQTGLRPLGAFYLGTRQVNLRDIGREVMTPADMEGVKLRMPNSPTWLFMGEALGANPTPLAFTEVYLGLQTGTIDGQDNPLPTDRNAKFYEVTKYIVLTDHYINPIFPTINEAKWQSLTPSQQQAVLQALEKARQFVDDANLQQEAELIEFFEGEGMTIITPDKQAFIDFAQDKTLNNAEMTATWDMDLFQQIQASAQ